MIKNFVRNVYLKIMLRKKDVRIGSGARISHLSVFGGFNSFGAHSKFSGEIGRYSYIGPDSYVYGKIGKFSSIGSDVRVLAATHPLDTFVSTHPVFYSLKSQCGTTFAQGQEFDEIVKADDNYVGISIGNDVWIGSNVVILGGITIGDGAVIAAGSIVTKDVEAYAIVGGNPAKVIRYRFESEVIEKLLKFEWWNRSDEWLRANAAKFRSMEAFTGEFLK